MKKYMIVLAALAVVLTMQASPRKANFDSSWMFHRGALVDAESTSYDDSSWRLLDLPHDWSVEPLENQVPGLTIGPFTKTSVSQDAVGFTEGGEGWYRKSFTLPSADAGKLITLYFEGVNVQSEIFVNGRKAYSRPYGYISFRVDITPYLNAPGQRNVIAVRVLNEGKNSRWYAGSGIFRHVWLLTTDRRHIDTWKTYIRTENVGRGTANLSLSTELENVSGLTLNVDILSADGKVVARKSVPASPHISLPVSISRPQLWSPSSPVRYRAVLLLRAGSATVDEVAIPFGIRTLSWSAQEGFLVNGKETKLVGGCVHHDYGFLGAAAYDKAELRKLQLMRAQGYNAVRCSHNLPSEEFLNICDSLGIMVIDECFDQWNKAKNPNDFHLYFKEWSDRDVKTMVQRDRNHPSVVMWSIGNEIPDRIDSIGVATAARLRQDILSLDTTRPLTMAVCTFWDIPGKTWKDSEPAFRSLDIGGYNYMNSAYDSDHQKYPQRVMVGTESYPMFFADMWKQMTAHKYVIGDFVWTAVDYLGEAAIGHFPMVNYHLFVGWPWYNGWCGDIDLCGDKKPQSYYRDVVMGRTPIAMMAGLPTKKGERGTPWGWYDEWPNWTFSGREGQDIRVRVFSKSPAVRLYLNGKQVGEAPTDTLYTASFVLPYQAGTLKAVALYGNKEKAAAQLVTTGAPEAVRLTADRTVIAADAQDLAYVSIHLVDANGNVVYDSSRKMKITVSGDGVVAGSGNASPNDMESFRSLTPRFFNGRAMVIVKSGRKAGCIHVTVESEGMKAGELDVMTK